MSGKEFYVWQWVLCLVRNSMSGKEFYVLQ